jgi:hypothetical protein
MKRIKSLASYKSTLNDYIGKTVYHARRFQVYEVVPTSFTENYAYIDHLPNDSIGIRPSQRRVIKNLYLTREDAELRNIKDMIRTLDDDHHISLAELINFTDMIKQKHPEELL